MPRTVTEDPLHGAHGFEQERRVGGEQAVELGQVFAEALTVVVAAAPDSSGRPR